MKTKIKLDDFFQVVPRNIIEGVFSKKELKHFDDYMVGQTISLLKQQGGYYVTDIARFLRYRQKGLLGKEMPLDD